MLASAPSTDTLVDDAAVAVAFVPLHGHLAAEDALREVLLGCQAEGLGALTA